MRLARFRQRMWSRRSSPMISRISKISAILIAATFVFGVVLAADFRDEGDRRIFADGLFSREMYKLAAIEYARLLDEFPAGQERDMLFFRLGEALRLSGDRASAAKAYLKVSQMKDAPFRHKALFKRAAIFLEIDQPEAAIELFASLLAETLSADIREMSLYYYGDALSKTEHITDACKTFETIIKDYPKGEMAAFSKLSLGRLYAMPGETANPTRSRELLADLVASPPTPRLGAEALFMLARADFTASDFKAAAESFRQLELKYPNDIRVPESQLQAGWAYLNSGFYDNALKSCAAALDGGAQPPEAERVEYLYIRACAYFQLLRYDESVKWYTETAKASPSSPFAAKSWYQVALSSYRNGKFGEAMTALTKVIADKELRQDALWLMAEAAAGNGDADTSVQYYKMLVSEYPESPYAPDALYRLGHQLQLRKSWADASVFFLQLAERFPDSALASKALFASASSLSSAGQGAQALRDWEGFLKRFPNDSGVPEALFQKALEEVRVDRKTEALATLDSLVSRFPQTPRLPDAQFWRGQLLREKGSLKDAEKAFLTVLQSKPTDDVLRETRFSLAMVLQQDGRENEAATIFQDLINDPIRSKFTPQQFAWLSEHQYYGNDFVNAEKTALILVEQTTDPSWKQVAWTLAGRARRARKMTAEAETAFRNAVQIDMKSRYFAESTLRLAEVLLERGENAEAEKYFSLAVQRCAAPELQDMRIYAYTGLGHAALAAGRKDDAVRYLMTVCLLYKNDTIIPGILVETINLLDGMGRGGDAATLRAELTQTYPKSKEAVEASKPLEGVN